MVTQVNSSLPAAVHQNHYQVMPLVAALAFEVLVYLLTQATTSLMGRVQSLDNPGKLHQDGCSDFQNKFYDEAINKFTLALECDPDQDLQAAILADRAEAYLASGDIEEAKADYDRALQCYPIEEALRAQIYFERGFFRANGGNHGLAIEDYNNAFKVAGPQEQAVIKYQRGCSYAALNRYEEAIGDFIEAANGCDPADQETRVLILENRAMAYIKMGSQEDALNDYKLLCDLDEDQRLRFQGSVFFCQGAICIKNHEYEKVIENYTKVLECDSYRPEAKVHILFLRGYAYGCLEKFDLCETDISEAIECGPKEDGVQLFGARAVARVALKKYPEAILDLTTAMDIHPADEEWKAELLYCRGVAHRKNNNPIGARQDWEAALKCSFKKKGLRESIEAELNQKTGPSGSPISALLHTVASRLSGSLQK